MLATDLFPPAPEGVPENFTRPSQAYQLRTFAVLGGLFLFLLVYLVLIAATAYAGWWLAHTPPPIPHGKAAILVLVAYIGGLICVGMLLLFLVKGLFKGQSTDRSGYILVTRQEQPELFRFIDRICDETSAPRPAGVYVSPDVNAAVFYNTSLINLIVPPRKYLLIGAGLVNAVNLREFKAVLAHEFGHFSQKSLALGTYVYVANRVLGDIVYARDKWDDVLQKWCGLDLRISFPAWGLRGVVWVLRGSLEQVFKGINLLNLSLSRQMEFNADDVAVSVAGSDAIVSALCRIEFADRCHTLAARELSTAADHGLHSRDIFRHQDGAIAHLRAVNNRPDMGIPPAPPARVFDPGDASGVPQMWRTHPANHDREANAKRHYLPAAGDDRSPWLLFRDSDALRARLSAAFYKAPLGRTVAQGELDDPGQVQSFIDSERAETNYDPKYHGLFDGRALRVPDPATVPPEDSRPDARERLRAYFADFPPADLAAVIGAHAKRREEAGLLEGLSSGNYRLKGKTFSFRECDVTMKDVPRLLDDVNRELETDYARFVEWDAAMYTNHYQAAHLLDPARAADLRRRYEWQMTVQNWIFELMSYQNRASSVLEAASRGEVQEDQFYQIKQVLQNAADFLRQVYAAAGAVSCPAMSNVREGKLLVDLIRPDDWRDLQFAGGSIAGGQIAALMTGYAFTLDKLRRMFFKGMGNILSKQEEICADFMAASGAAPAGAAMDA
jgi:Zn-dependent protease with chaperone function